MIIIKEHRIIHDGGFNNFLVDKLNYSDIMCIFEETR